MLHKTLANSVKDVDMKQGIICAYASSFGVVDDGNDEVVKGAFLKTIAEQGPQSRQPRIKFLFEHDVSAILGVPHIIREDDFGLYFEAKIQPTALGSDILTLYAASCITEHSIGYETVVSEWDRQHAVRLLKELRLFEVSAVTFGMNSHTPVVAIKSLLQPAYLLALSDRAQKLDKLLHDGSLRSDALCETLDRELKSLHAALAPADAASQPYTIQGVMDNMAELATRLEAKGARQDDKKAQAARAKQYGIGIKDGGNVTKPGQWSALTDADFGDPTNYKLPLPDKVHADNAAARFGQEATRAQYTAAEQAIIDKRIAAAQKTFGEDDSAKGATMTTQAKASESAVEVGKDGTHTAFTGTHTHSHKAFGSQGDDDQHGHEHDHADDATHDHAHAEKAAPKPVAAPKAAPQPSGRKQPDGRTVRKARDFDTLFQSLNAADELQDDWGDTFIAFVNAMSELMWQASAVTNGWASDEDAKGFDAAEAAQANLDAFSKAVLTLVQRSVAADFVPQMTHDCDQFIDPDGTQDDDGDDDGDDDDYKGRAPRAMPAAPAPLKKAGRSISEGNRKTITEALDGMGEAMKAMKGHHGAIADLMTKTDPDHTRQDEDTALGDDDTMNGGTNPTKSRFAPRHAPERHEAATTHQQGVTLSAVFADADAITSRLGGRKAR